MIKGVPVTSEACRGGDRRGLGGDGGAFLGRMMIPIKGWKPVSGATR